MAQSPRVIKFIQNKKAPVEDNDDVIESGRVGDLNYEVFRRGNIHIYDKKLRFKKDAELFEEEFRKLNFDAMKDDEKHVLKGCGDNDDLVFTKTDGEIKMFLKKRSFETISKLFDIINKGLSSKKKSRGKTA